MRITSFGLALVLLAGPIAPQDTKDATPTETTSDQKSITNTDVLNMVRAGLPDNTIILAIQHGKANFSTSPRELIDLKNQGVSGKILDAMLNVNMPKETPSNPTRTEDSGVAPVQPARGYKGIRIGQSVSELPKNFVLGATYAEGEYEGDWFHVDILEGRVVMLTVIYSGKSLSGTVISRPISLDDAVKNHSFQSEKRPTLFGEAIDANGARYGIVDVENQIVYAVDSLQLSAAVKNVAYVPSTAPVLGLATTHKLFWPGQAPKPEPPQPDPCAEVDWPASEAWTIPLEGSAFLSLAWNRTAIRRAETFRVYWEDSIPLPDRTSPFQSKDCHGIADVYMFVRKEQVGISSVVLTLAFNGRDGHVIFFDRTLTVQKMLEDFNGVRGKR